MTEKTKKILIRDFAFKIAFVFIILLFISKTVSPNLGLDEDVWIAYIIYIDAIYLFGLICIIKFLCNITSIMKDDKIFGIVTAIGTIILTVLLLKNYEIIAVSMDLLTSNSEIALIGRHYNAFAIFSDTSGMNQLMMGFIIFGFIEYLFGYINLDSTLIEDYLSKLNNPTKNETKEVELKTQKISNETMKVFLLDESSEQKYYIQKKEFKIGKREDNDLVISENYISRIHATIIQIGDEYCLMDNGSSNYTFVNGTKLDEGKGYSLKDGDRLKFANKEYVFINQHGTLS